MKKLSKLLLFIVCALCFAQSAKADTYVNGYYRKNGTYVAPHYRSDANGTKRDNWSTAGNVNPYTGQKPPLLTMRQKPPKNRGLFILFSSFSATAKATL